MDYMSEVAHLSFSEIRSAAHDLAEQRKEARENYEKRVRIWSQAEAEFRRIRAEEFQKQRNDGKGVKESEILADGVERVILARQQRDNDQGLIAAAKMKVEEVERNQSTLRQLGDFSMSMESIG